MRSIGIGSKTARQQLAGCRIHVQDAIRRLQPDRAPDIAEKYLHRHERSYNEVRVSTCCRADRGRFDLCQCFCADAAAVSTSGNTTAAETDPACAVINATAGNYSPASSDHSGAPGAASSNAADTRGESTFRDRGVLSDLPDGSIPGVVRRRARSAVLHLWSHGSVCRRGDVLPHAT